MIIRGICGSASRGPVGIREHLDEIESAFRSGETLQMIGDRFDVTRERVRQLLKELGLTRQHGGQAKRTESKNQTLSQIKDAVALEKHGCTYAQYRGLLRTGRGATTKLSPVGAFIQQRNNANLRGIPWEFKLWEWWTVWVDSGKQGQRGRGAGLYVMARNGDTGPYSKENVYITTCSQNIKDSYTNHPHSARNVAAHRDHEGLTPRQRQVLDMEAAGADRQKIAETLNISRSSVKTTLYWAKKALIGIFEADAVRRRYAERQQGIPPRRIARRETCACGEPKRFHGHDCAACHVKQTNECRRRRHDLRPDIFGPAPAERIT